MSSQPYRATRAVPYPVRREPDVVVPRTPSRLGLLVTKMIAILLLFGASGLLYHVAASDDFRVSDIVVVGAQLVTVAEIREAAAISGLNIFWVKQEEVGHRLQAISAIQSAR